MRLHYVVLLAIAASNAVALSATTNSKLVASDLPERSRSLTEGQHEAPNRHLREEDTTEERTFSIKATPGLEKFKSIPSFDKFKGLFKTKVTLGTLLGWAKKGKSPDKVFTAYELDKTGTKLFESPDFKIWYTYTALVTKTDPEKAVLTSLVGRFGESTVSSMLEGAMKVSGTKEIATALQMKQMES
ncbi:putative secreted RxLR effector protein [Phytophthora cinnamomi]|uniref:putative secreted RxLR effector protein n=1 Tax=Phytophthora cinnamomi TaxID=4785 RepID=UPI002A2A2625|nr:putative secreted RxLR effector protein [Phytophthora cinnamomi]KAJ8552543.1 hypothetical protein ON010_g10005 [Phytophthora cinnamomi]